MHLMPYRQGFILLPVMLTLVLVAVVALMLNQQSAMDTSRVGSEMEAQQTELIAKAGLKHAEWLLQESVCSGDITLPQTAFSGGSYSAQIDTGYTSTAYTIDVDQDAFLSEIAPDTNYGFNSELLVEATTNQQKRAVYRYDLSAIALNAEILSATAWFYVNQNDDQAAVSLYAINADWAENGATWNNLSTAYDPQPFSAIPRQTASGNLVSVNITSLVQGWVNGTKPNNGVMLIGASDGVSGYGSQEWAVLNQRPHLEVQVGNASGNPVSIDVDGTHAGGNKRVLTYDDARQLQQPVTITIQGGAIVADTYIDENDISHHTGANEDLRSNSASGERKAPLIKFNLGSLPVGAKVGSAKFDIYLYDSGGSATDVVEAHRLTRDWQEGPDGYLTGATWNRYDDTNDWDTPGGDYEAEIQGSFIANTPGWKTIDVSHMVQFWLDHPKQNYGMILLSPIAAGYNEKRYHSSDYSDPNLLPRLHVTLACDCGEICINPRDQGNLLLVVSDAAAPESSDLQKKAVFESWGYTVTLISEDASQISLNAEMGNNDVVYVSATVDETIMGTKLTYASIGVVSEHPALVDELGFAAAQASVVGAAMDIMDASHPVSTLFPQRMIDLYSANMKLSMLQAPLSTDLTVLGTVGGTAAFAVLSPGDLLQSGGYVSSRRVALPFDQSANNNWAHFNSNALALISQAVRWAAEKGSTLMVYWTDDVARKVQRADVMTPVVEDLVINLTAPTGLDVDVENGLIYFTDNLQIKRANLDGSGVTTLINQFFYPQDVKLDRVKGNLYWTVPNLNAVYSSKIDGSSTTLLTTSVNGPAYLSFDEAGKLIYFSEYVDNSVSRCESNGNNCTRLVKDLSSPIGHALDLAGGKVYWSDGSGGDKIWRANLNGTGQELVIGGEQAPQDIAVDTTGGKIYWAAADAGKIRRANLDGSNPEDVVTGLYRPRGVVLALVSEGVGAPVAPPSEDCNGVFRDEFNTVSFSGNDGTLAWSNDWQEIGESDGPGSGDIVVSNNLRLQDNDNGGEGVMRTADLSRAQKAALSMDATTSGLDSSSDYVDVLISADGESGPWEQLQRIAGPSNTVDIKVSHDISKFLSANTTVRLITSPSMGGSDRVYFDNVQIECK
jgi:hypothetical protein